MSSIFYLIGLYLITRSNSVQRTGCIPANTCFTIHGGSSDPDLDSSYKFLCNADGSVVKRKYDGNTDCSADEFDSNVASGGTISEGDKVVGSGSGVVTTAYLQGTNCPINQPSEDCTKYMVLKHRGDDSHKNSIGADIPYLDIGDNCTNYIDKESTFTHYTSVQIPTGCINLFVGSNLLSCDANGWSYVHYDGQDCTGNVESAQSDDFDVDKCGYFSEWTHCQNGQTSGCPGDGVHDYWWYWYDLDCCPINGKTCSGTAAGTNSGGPSGNNGSPTGSPTTPTPQPTGPGLKGTAAPTAKPTAPTASHTKDASEMKCAIFGLFIIIGILVNM